MGFKSRMMRCAWGLRVASTLSSLGTCFPPGQMTSFSRELVSCPACRQVGSDQLEQPQSQTTCKPAHLLGLQDISWAEAVESVATFQHIPGDLPYMGGQDQRAAQAYAWRAYAWNCSFFTLAQLAFTS